MREKKKIKEWGDRDSGHVYGGEKQDKKKIKRMDESEMKKGKII